ncbi:hypothetical protein HMPREF9536_02506 [Escherichia coli MS 84-1]|nr:hypothetical protein HMPREF9536_02506 [Escherichia coli MS 84-1]
MHLIAVIRNLTYVINSRLCISATFQQVVTIYPTVQPKQHQFDNN